MDGTQCKDVEFGFVRQHVMFMSGLTVLEHLNFVAKCRLAGQSEEARVDRVKSLVKQFRLLKCMHVKIVYLSGGEQKRLAFASAYIHGPGMTCFKNLHDVHEKKWSDETFFLSRTLNSRRAYHRLGLRQCPGCFRSNEKYQGSN